MEKFGFSEKTGIDLPAELRGDITNLSTGRDINYATASFGQGVAVTPIEVVERVKKRKGATGGHFSQSYLIESPEGDRAFLKAVDWSCAINVNDPARALQTVLEAFNF
ncbi:hypothetical protein IIA28_11340, partial [candidate division KSB1 bacterium]|nr:hypothetical protein [candidate division KSB1 bacterium]